MKISHCLRLGLYSEILNLKADLRKSKLIPLWEVFQVILLSSVVAVIYPYLIAGELDRGHSATLFVSLAMWSSLSFFVEPIWTIKQSIIEFRDQSMPPLWFYVLLLYCFCYFLCFWGHNSYSCTSQVQIEIICNDCQDTAMVQFHVLGHKCLHLSKNSKTIRKI